jgi:hypothetical protein
MDSSTWTEVAAEVPLLVGGISPILGAVPLTSPRPRA